MFNHLIPLCWNTTTKLLKCRIVWAISNVLNHLHDIIYLSFQWKNSSTSLQRCGLHADFCSCERSHPRQRCIHTAAWWKLWTWPWQCVLTPRPKERQETAAGWLKWFVGLSPHASGCSSFSLVCGWSVCLHHFTPGGEEGAWEEGEGGQTYCRSWRKLFRGDSLPLSWENSINYLRWQMFTDPNMHGFVELAGFPRPNVLVFTMRAEAVVILAVLQRALIWAVSTPNHFGGNYFTP